MLPVRIAARVFLAAALVAGASQVLGQSLSPGAATQQPAADAPAVASDSYLNVAPVSWMQQPALSAPSAPATAPRSTRSSRSNVGLASVPNMFGDLAGATTTVTFRDEPSPGGQTPPFGQATFTLPVAGGGSRIGKIAENDSPIPQDRVFFSYNHFHNVFELSETANPPPGPTTTRQFPINRYTLGFEKTFFGGDSSVELRLPLQGIQDAQLQSVGLSSATLGNLTVVLKELLYMDEALAVGAGMAIETPTGADTFARLDNVGLQFNNQSWHLLPYIGFIWSPGDPQWGWGSGLFLTGFAQIDINTGSNAIDVRVDGSSVGSLGKLTDQNLGFLDLGLGYWLYRDPDAPRLTGIAALTELHYTTSLQNADQIAGNVDGNLIAINGTGNRFDVLNGTVGLQFLLFDASSLRVAGVFPIGNEDRRLFDSEVQVQFNRRF